MPPLDQPLLEGDTGDEEEELPEPDDLFAYSAFKQKLSNIHGTVWFQGLLLLLVLFDVIILIIGLVVFARWIVTLATVLLFFFFAELLLRIHLTGTEEFFKLSQYRWYNIAECILLCVALIVEIIDLILTSIHTDSTDDAVLAVEIALFEAGNIPMIIIQVVKSFLMFKQRSELAKKYTRQFVSADRRRYKQDGFDLDLTYITPKVIAMSWPATKVEALYRNNIDDVAKFLDTKHRDNYRVFPLCSERMYDHTKFHDYVTRFKLDDHNPCDLAMIMEFVKDARKHLEGNSDRIIVVHCKGGKGRTGTMICSWLLYSGTCATAEEALKFFGQLRSSDTASKIQGVESPSQERYVAYFASLVKMNCGTPLDNWLLKISNRQVRLLKIRLLSRPTVVVEPKNLWFVILAGSSNQLYYLSDRTQHLKPSGCNRPDNLPASSVPCRFGQGSIDMKYHVLPGSTTVVLEYQTTNAPLLSDDLHVQFFHFDPKEKKKKKHQHALFQFWLHTFFLTQPTLRLDRGDIDGCHKDKHFKTFDADFAVELEFDLNPSSSNSSPASPPTLRRSGGSLHQASLAAKF